MKTINEIMEQKHENNIKLLKDIFSTRLKDLRQEKGLSQNNIANKLKCAVSTYANWEQGRREPSILVIQEHFLYFQCLKILR